MIFRRVQRGVLIAAIVTLAGCRGFADPLTSTVDRSPHQTTHGVTMLDKSVRDAFILDQQPVARRTPDGQLQVQFMLRNRFQRGDLFADVQFQFFDAAGQVVEKSEWRTMEFPARELVQVEGLSLRGDVKSFNVQFKNLASKDGRVPSGFGFIFEKGVWLPALAY